MISERSREIARRDFRIIYGDNKVPRGRLLDEFARTLGTLHFDGQKWHHYSGGLRVQTVEDIHIRLIARKLGVSQKMVRTIAELMKA